MPRNPKAAALARAVAADINYRRGAEALTQLSEKRRQSMADCLEAGCTTSEVARIFGVSRSFIWKQLNLEKVS